MKEKGQSTQSTNNTQAVALIGSIVSAIFPITEKDASIHVWTTQVPEQDDTKSPWDSHALCPRCFIQMSSTGHECW